MGHYDACYESDAEEARQEHERRVKAKYEKMLSEKDLTHDKLKDAVLYLLECKWKHGSIPEKADIHIRRLKNEEGFEA